MDWRKSSDAIAKNKIDYNLTKIKGRGQDQIFAFRKEMHGLQPRFHQRLS